MSEGGMLNKLKPYLISVLLQFGYAGMSIIAVASMKKGMNHYVLVVYRNAFATAVMAPFALWFERKARPKITVTIFLKIVALGLLEPVLDQNLYYMGANNTSASYGSSLYNILPAITFIMALLLRMEKIKIKTRHSQAKIMGTIVMVVGALLMIMYKGPIIHFVWSKGRAHRSTTATSTGDSWLVGTFELLASYVCWSAFYIVQANVLESYPAELSLATLICLMGAMLSAVVTLVIERGNAKIWSIGWDLRLFTVAYSAVVCSGVAYYAQGIVMKERGPVFVTAFTPLCMIVTTIMGSIVLAEDVTLGRILGAVIIVIGLYSLIWGKSNDQVTLSTEGNEKKDGTLRLPVSANGEIHPDKEVELRVN